MDAQNETPPPLFTKREKYALALLTVSFIVASALVHFILGGFGSTLFPHFQPEAAASVQKIIIDTLATPTPTPTPVPTPRIIPTAAPHAQRTSSPQPRSPAHRGPTRPSEHSTPRTFVDRAFPTGPPVVAPSTAQPTAVEPASATTSPVPEQVTDSDFVQRVTPDYPQIAIDESIQGTVTVRVTIGSDGQVEDAVVVQSSGNIQLDAAALRAARESVYRAPLLDGKPTTRDYLIIYTFSLDAE